MAAKFELRTWMTENRETVIVKFEKLTEERFYNGITLKAFMMEVYTLMSYNCKSAKKAASFLPSAMGSSYVDNSKVFADDKITDRLKAAYRGTAAMAMV